MTSPHHFNYDDSPTIDDGFDTNEGLGTENIEEEQQAGKVEDLYENTDTIIHNWGNAETNSFDSTKPPDEAPDALENNTVDIVTEEEQIAHENKKEADTLKYHLLGPSATKAGLATDQSRISEIIYEASKGSKFFQREEEKDRQLSEKTERLRQRKEALLLRHELNPYSGPLERPRREADTLLAQLEDQRDLTQWIVHVDCDAFFAAVEELEQPDLKDVPFAVGLGVLCTANYHARRYGCRSGMASFVAKKLCPHLKLLPLRHGKYSEKAKEVRAILAQYDERFESASCDEAYLNITEYCHQLGPDTDPAEVVQEMRRRIHQETKITVSAGLAANARLAKICSDINKPNGQFVLPRTRQAIMDFMGELPPRKVNGVGRVLERELSAGLNIQKCSEIYEHRALLAPLLGEKAAHFLLRCYLGVGRTHIRPAEEYERKSVGTERTFADIADRQQIREKLRIVAQGLEQDLRKARCKGRTLVLKVKLHTFEVYTRQSILPKSIATADEIYYHGLQILEKLEKEYGDTLRLRLLGLRCTNLSDIVTKNDIVNFFGKAAWSAIPKADVPEDDTAPLEDKIQDDPYKEKQISDTAKNWQVDEVEVDEDGWEVWPGSQLIRDRETLQTEASTVGAGNDGDSNDQLNINKEPELQTDHQVRACSPENTSHISGISTEKNTPPPQSEHAPNSSREETREEPEIWECPVCFHTQYVTDVTMFNAHIDLCLSRQAIRQIVQELDEENLPVPVGNGAESGTSKKLDHPQHRQRQKSLKRLASPLPTENEPTHAAKHTRKRKTKVDPKQKKLEFIKMR